MKNSITLSGAAVLACLVFSANIYADGKGHNHGHETKTADPDAIAAVVNGKPILKLAAERVAQQIQAQGQDADINRIVDELINLEVLTQAAEKLELDKAPEVATALQLQYTQTMANAYLGAFSNDHVVTEEQMRAEYDKQIAAIDTVEYKASHILMDSQDAAADVLAKIETGSDFAEMAKEHSTGPTGPNGGDLGWFQPENMVPEFSAAVSQMDVGAVSSEPVQTQFGWHIISLTDKREAAKPDYSDPVKAGIRNTLISNALAAQVEKLRQEATIEIK
jgi:peptidyl-prolyl cis-trans isomerase C